ncbi:hypothetical protein [Stomatohabitans albus]|uniref:hypothetical protein n=1 Tax=Stomatohabitans albus TaxID=3110766 RepID=UPI00300D7D96
MTTRPPTFRDVYAVLAATTDPGEWWPADTPFEICVGAVLTQNTAWRNVVRSLIALKAAHGVEAEQILGYPSDMLEAPIRPSGF